jgi:hypothetical protein
MIENNARRRVESWPIQGGEVSGDARSEGPNAPKVDRPCSDDKSSGRTIIASLAALPDRRHQVMRKLLIALSTLAVSAAAGAQLPGTPVLQNAWATPGLVGAVNIGGGSGAGSYAAALAWAPSNGRFQLSGGAGMQSGIGSGNRGTYGVRAAFPIAEMMGGNLGLGGFVGVGGGSGNSGDSTATKTFVPAGVSIGWRHALGSRGFSVYGSPAYHWRTGKAGSSSGIRVATGIDFGLAANFGVTGGIEFGQSVAAGKVGPRGTTYGLGASYAFGNR